MARTSSLPSKEIRQLEKRFRPGYEIGQHDGAGHWTIVGPDGETVRNEDGQPVTLASTPKGGGPHYSRRIDSLLEAAGVIDRNGSKPERKKPTPEAQSARVAALRETTRLRAIQRQKVADELYQRLDPIVSKLGGWEVDGLTADIVYVGALIARERDLDMGGNRAATPDVLHSSLSRVKSHGWVVPVYQAVWSGFCEEMETADDLIVHFYALVRKARGLPEAVVTPRPASRLDVDGEWPFRVELVTVDALIVDHDYQRPVNWAFVRKLAASFDERLVGALDVAERRPGTYAILDGQLRFEAMRLRQKRTAWVAVYAKMEKSAEARFFLHKNKDRKQIHPYYIFKARVVAEEPDAIEIERIVKEAGYVLLSSNSSPDNAHILTAIAAVQEAYSRKGAGRTECLSATLGIMQRSTYGRPNGNNNVLIRALAHIFSRFSEDEVDETRLETTLLSRSPDLWLARTHDIAHSGSTKANSLARIILGEYNEKLPREQRLAPGRLAERAET